MKKYFDNLTLGQYLLTGISPIKVYVEGRYLILTDTDDIEDPLYGFGMMQSGEMVPFDYRLVDHILVGDQPVSLEMLNKSGESKGEDKGKEKGGEDEETPEFLQEPEEEKPAKEKKKEESMRSSKLTDILKEADAEEKKVRKEKEEYLKAKMKAAKKDLDDFLKKEVSESDEYRPIADDTAYSNIYEHEDEWDDNGYWDEDEDEDDEWDDEELDFDVEDDDYEYDSEYDEDEEIDFELEDDEDEDEWDATLGDGLDGDDEFDYEHWIEDDEEQDVTAVSDPYTIKVGDLVHNTDCGCKHYGSKGFVISVEPGDMIRYSITNSGPFYKLGDIVTKNMSALESI